MTPQLGSSMWRKVVGIPPLPPQGRKMPVRPKKKRIRHPSEVEDGNGRQCISRVGRTMTCKKCWTKGHNRASCTSEQVEKPRKVLRKPGRPKKDSYEGGCVRVRGRGGVSGRPSGVDCNQRGGPSGVGPSDVSPDNVSPDNVSLDNVSPNGDSPTGSVRGGSVRGAVMRGGSVRGGSVRGAVMRGGGSMRGVVMRGGASMRGGGSNRGVVMRGGASVRGGRTVRSASVRGGSFTLRTCVKRYASMDEDTPSEDDMHVKRRRTAGTGLTIAANESTSNGRQLQAKRRQSERIAHKYFGKKIKTDKYGTGLTEDRPFVLD